VLTHLAHFHLRGASEAAAVSEATYGWAQGHFLGAYLGGGVDDAAPALDNFNGGWAQGSLFAYYYGPGATAEPDVVIPPVVDGGGGGVGRERGWSAKRDIDADEPVSLEQLLAEDEDLLLMIAAAVHKRLI
jgi:hypothetical protein